MSSYPDSLKYLLSKSSCSRNSFRLELKGGNSGSAGQVLTLELPNNSLVDLSTLAMYFSATATYNQAVANHAARLPNKLDTLISRIDVDIGGVSVSSFNNYGELACVKDTMLTNSKLRSRFAINHETVYANSSIDSTLAGTALTTGETFSGCISRWFSILGECQPQVIDTGLMPTVTIRFTLATNNICSVGDTSAMGAYTANETASYALSGIYFIVDVISFSDGKYDELVSSLLASEGSIKIPFKNYSSTSSTTATTRWSVSAQSIDACYACLRDSAAYPTTNMPYAVLNGSNFNTSFLKNISNYFRFQQRGVTGYQWKTNGVLMPQNRATPLQAFMSLLSLTPNRESSITSLQQYLDSHFVIPLKLNCSDRVDQLTGFDSRQSNAVFELSLDNMAANTEVLVFTEYTSVLRVLPGKAVVLDM